MGMAILWFPTWGSVAWRRSAVLAWAVRARPFSGSQHGGKRGLEEERCAAIGERRGGGGQRREEKKRREERS
jgi:hypothetical protein